MMYSLKKQRGFSLMEILAVLVIVAVLASLIYRAYFSGKDATNSRALTQQISQLSMTIEKIYPFGANPNGRYTGLTNAVLINTNQAPEEMVNTTSGTLIHQENGTVTCVATTLDGVANAGAKCTWANVTESSCLTGIPATENLFKEITVGSTVIKNASTTYSQPSVVTACSGGLKTLILTQN